MRIIQYLIFTIFIPCTVGVYLPLLIDSYNPLKLYIGSFRYLGLLFVFTGCLLYFSSSILFLKNKGTPAMWFVKRLKPLIGYEPDVLIKSNLYSFSRNPMYLGVSSFIFGTALLKDSFSILIYFFCIIFIFNLVIVFIEEPHLKKKHREEYLDYIKTVPRWFKIF